MVDLVLVVRFWVEGVVGALVDEESLGGGGEVEALVLAGDYVQVHEIAFHFARAWGRVEAAEGELLETLEGLCFEAVEVDGTDGHVFGMGKHVVGWQVVLFRAIGGYLTEVNFISTRII